MAMRAWLADGADLALEQIVGRDALDALVAEKRYQRDVY
jgi:sulfite reductase alpha subunit-like flavoprotein